MTTEQNKAVVLRFNKEVIEEKNIGIIDELFLPAFINRTVRLGFSPGPDGMIAFLKILWQAFSEIKVEIHDQVAEGDKVTTRKTIHGIHTGQFMNLPASNKKVEIKIIDIVRLSEGKYAEHWSVIDMQSVENFKK
ncbi:MAG: ester cyclase [Bacteroidetes bacterium]|nr:ester cyclase [Bacteroidota bacterium]